MQEWYCAEELGALSLLAPAHRGRAFSGWVARAFRRSGYAVREDARAAKPRDTDVFVTGEQDLLVECKWLKDPAGVGDVDSLRSRLDRTPSHVLGVLVSMSGFTRPAIAEVNQRRDRLILLVDKQEVVGWLAIGGISTLLRHKRVALLRDGTSLFAKDRALWARDLKAEPTSWTLPDTTLLSDGLRPWIRADHGFERTVFVEQIPDVDWTIAQGGGVGLDLDLPLHSIRDVHNAIEVLARSGWISGKGTFTINQSEQSWHGWGAAHFAAAVSSQRDRYRDLTSIHHTEKLTYFDHCRAGFYTLAFDLEARRDRVTRAHLSARLPGVPIDPGVDRMLAQAFDLDREAVYRPLREHERFGIWQLGSKQLRVKPADYLVTGSPLDDGAAWVCGVVAPNPLFGGRDRELNSNLGTLRTLICYLSDYHPEGEARRYSVARIENTRTADAEVIAVRARW